MLEALLWAFHNARNGLCFSSYEKIAEAAHCARSTIAEAIKALEDAGSAHGSSGSKADWNAETIVLQRGLPGLVASRSRKLAVANTRAGGASYIAVQQPSLADMGGRLAPDLGGN